MTLNCAIIDHSEACIRLLADQLSNSKAKLKLVHAYPDQESALTELKQGHAIDILFMHYPTADIDELQLARLLKTKIKYLVITASDPSYALDAFDLNACGYLLKPILQEKLDKTVIKILEKEQAHAARTREPEHFFIKSNINELSKIYINDIIAIEGASNYVKIYTTDKKTYMTYGKMRDYEIDLTTSGNFIRVNKSYIISIPAIRSIKRKKITLYNDIQVSIGITYKESLKQIKEILKSAPSALA